MLVMSPSTRWDEGCRDRLDERGVLVRAGVFWDFGGVARLC